MVSRDGRGDAGNSLKIERRQIEGKCGRTIATEPRASDGPAGVVITTLSASLSLLCFSPLFRLPAPLAQHYCFELEVEVLVSL